MDHKTKLHIEYLREMLNTKWAEEARRELSAIYAELAEKGIFAV